MGYQESISTNLVKYNHLGIMMGSERNFLNSALISLLSWSMRDVILCIGNEADADNCDLGQAFYCTRLMVLLNHE